ncbi:DHH family phosphoesterase [Sulfurihydrogenibium azorense]|uniref:DHH family phosphoesterase n=1 Tax=Sulfurihydrogenibium azorense TaxID=309806 RepID=UPI00240A9C2C|nr:DHHA1 domain-containing protein [Sulfurihydrogenibium azorense]MDM7273936.1 DHHA1 domain-containing protein [Sulfurihydrogenibium azorense]
MKTVCIYHKNCTDGTTAAAILLLKYPDCKLFPLDHNYREEEFQPILDEVDKDTTVYIVDFSIKQPFFEKLVSKAKEVINIDHHISAKDMIEEFTKKYNNFKLVFDNDKSGASLTWKYLFGSNPPDIVKYVEDKDIWKWEFGDTTKYVNDYLFLYTNKPQELRQLLDKDINEIIEKGKIINQYTTYLIDSFVEKSKDLYIQIGSYKVRAYNTGLFQSEIGNKLSTLHNEAVCLFSINGDYVKLSFRSLDHHNPSALDLAKMLNGGGHRNAAGASMSLKEFCNILLI